MIAAGEQRNLRPAPENCALTRLSALCALCLFWPTNQCLRPVALQQCSSAEAQWCCLKQRFRLARRRSSSPFPSAKPPPITRRPLCSPTTPAHDCFLLDAPPIHRTSLLRSSERLSRHLLQKLLASGSVINGYGGLRVSETFRPSFHIPPSNHPFLHPHAFISHGVSSAPLYLLLAPFDTLNTQHVGDSSTTFRPARQRLI